MGLHFRAIPTQEVILIGKIWRHFPLNLIIVGLERSAQRYRTDENLNLELDVGAIRNIIDVGEEVNIFIGDDTYMRFLLVCVLDISFPRPSLLYFFFLPFFIFFFFFPFLMSRYLLVAEIFNCKSKQPRSSLHWPLK